MKGVGAKKTERQRPGVRKNTKDTCSPCICQIAAIKLPHTSWFKTTQIYSLVVLVVRGLKSRGQQGYISSGDFKRELVPLPFQLLEAACIPWLLPFLPSLPPPA